MTEAQKDREVMNARALEICKVIQKTLPLAIHKLILGDNNETT
jgi:hypothetical protein